MKYKLSFKTGLAILLTTLIIFPSINLMTFGQKVILKNEKITDEGYVYSKFNKYHISKIDPDVYKPGELPSECSFDINENIKMIDSKHTVTSLSDSIDSPWPMYCHDVRHTGRSPYSTTDNLGAEKWRFDVLETCTGSPVVDNNGIIYIGAFDLFAVYPNGTLKWIFDADSGIITSAPAIDENGILYVGSIWKHPNFMYAIYLSNGTLKWKYKVGQDIWSSPAIGYDGSIYFGSENDYIYALYPNGTLKWKYLTNIAVYSSPAIGNDGTIYCGSHDTFLYAFYPDNGTVKWKYKTGHWIRTSPCIGDDGTIYVVSLDDHLHAVNPDGTRKWATNVGAGTSPTIGQDGTIYCGYSHLHAVNPDGTIKWIFNPGEDRTIQGATPCNSVDGVIYFGTHIGDYNGGELIAVNPDGVERWRIMLATDWVDSAPAIGEDQTIYVGSWNDGYHPGSWGYLHAIGELDSNAPSFPEIDGPKIGVPDVLYNFTFKSVSPLNNDLYYWIEWGDDTGTGWIGPYPSEQQIMLGHEWSKEKIYKIKARCKDIDNLWGSWGDLEVIIPRNKATSNSFLAQFLERFPLLTKLLPLLK